MGLFILPKKVTDQVDKLLRSFLWRGTDQKINGANVAWASITCLKSEGGLCIRKTEVWNRACMAKLIWNLCQINSTSLWVNWVKVHLLREHSFWDIPIPNNCSWTWRKLLQLRGEIRPFIHHIIGDGRHTWLWFDSWLPFGPILPRFNERVIYDSALARQTRVATIISDGQWVWPIANSPNLLILKQAIPNSMVPHMVIWSPSGSGKFTTKTAWHALRVRHSLVTWDKLIWFHYVIPKCGFILWLAIRERLGTLDRLYTASANGTCLLCNNQAETHDHLFFKCAFTKEIWGALKQKCRLSFGDLSWKDCIS